MEMLIARSLLGLGLIAAGGAACGGGDDTDQTGASVTPTTSIATPSELRLSCAQIARFDVVAAPLGSTFPSFSSADEAAQAEADRRNDVQEARHVGEEPDGSRYVLLDRDGAVIEEVVIGERDDGTLGVLYSESCA